MNIAPSAPSAGITALGTSKNAAAPTSLNAPGSGSSAPFGSLIATGQNGAAMPIPAARNNALPAVAADMLVTEITGQSLETDLPGTATTILNHGATEGQGDKAMALIGKPANAVAAQFATPLADAMAPEDGMIAAAADPADAQDMIHAEDIRFTATDMESEPAEIIPDHPAEASPSASSASVNLLPPTPLAVASPPAHQGNLSATLMAAPNPGEENLSTSVSAENLSTTALSAMGRSTHAASAARQQAMGAGDDAASRGATLGQSITTGAENAPVSADLPEGFLTSLMGQPAPGASHRSASVDQLYGAVPAGTQHLPVATARPGQIGREMGVEIARQISAGKEELCVRLDPAELGRIDVRMSFERDGGLRAVVTAESSVALDMLRRDAGDLTRALVDAGVRADAGSFRFDGRSGDGQRGQSQAEQGAGGRGQGASGAPDEDIPQYRRLATSGRIDMMA